VRDGVPTIAELTAAVFQMDALLKGDRQAARDRLARWLKAA
jgi:hypothetical protein